MLIKTWSWKIQNNPIPILHCVIFLMKIEILLLKTQPTRQKDPGKRGINTQTIKINDMPQSTSFCPKIGLYDIISFYFFPS